MGVWSGGPLPGSQSPSPQVAERVTDRCGADLSPEGSTLITYLQGPHPPPHTCRPGVGGRGAEPQHKHCLFALHTKTQFQKQFVSVNFIDPRMIQTLCLRTRLAAALPSYCHYFIAEIQKPCFFKEGKNIKMLINRPHVLPKGRYKMPRKE